MVVLGIETSGRTGTLAIVTNGMVVAERELSTAGRRHAQTLVQETKLLLESTAHQPNDISVLAISMGPGSFTGLRVGAAFAKTYCYATKAQLVAVDTLQCIAERAGDDVPIVHVIEDAQRGDVFANSYALDVDGRRVADSKTKTKIISVPQMVASLADNAVVTGPALNRYADEFSEFQTLDESVWRPMASTVALIGERIAAAGDFADITSFEPFYLRKSAAEEKRDAAK